METPQKGDDDDLVDTNTDTDRERNNENSEGKYQKEEIKKVYLEIDKLEPDERYQRGIKNNLKG